jgi:hypothetical protein
VQGDIDVNDDVVVAVKFKAELRLPAGAEFDTRTISSGLKYTESWHYYIKQD